MSEKSVLVLHVDDKDLNTFKKIGEALECSDDESFKRVISFIDKMVDGYSKSSVETVRLYGIRDAKLFVGSKDFHPAKYIIEYLTTSGEYQSTSIIASSYSELEDQWHSFRNKNQDVLREGITKFDIDFIPDDKKCRLDKFKVTADYLHKIFEGSINDAELDFLLSDNAFGEFFEAIIKSVKDTVNCFPVICKILDDPVVKLPNASISNANGKSIKKVISNKLE